MTSTTATLEWYYTPVDLIDDAHIFDALGATLAIQEGIARAVMDADAHNGDAALPGKLLRTIKARFAPYEHHKAVSANVSTSARLTLTHPDGSQEIYAELHESLTISDRYESQVIQEGQIRADTAQSKRDLLNSESALLAKHADDSCLCRILTSLTASNNDVGNRFLHLYEVYEALGGVFGKERHKISDALAIEQSRLRKFERICNGPNTASRHRGAAKGPLTKLTDADIQEARSIAWDLMMAYTRWLDRKGYIEV